MNKHESYTGIDYFRFLAALLIVAIHTSPLLSYSEMGDFILTRIIARVAVPFFFMTSGYFLISRYAYNSDKLRAFIAKTAMIYVAAIVIYIPLNIYNGYFQQGNFLPNMLKDILFDGTMYHLWFLPASILGAFIAWLLVKRLGIQKAFFITVILYIIGMFGDSYYGVSEQLPVMKHVYEAIFQVSDYTRNGIFFAPVFFVLGGMLADRSIRISLGKSIVGLVVSLSLMLGEGLVLHSLGLQRHDSMYISLLPCMFFLFSTLTFWKGQRVSFIRSSALIIYMIHPLAIVAVRMFARVFHFQELLVKNSLMHYFVVSILSVTFAFLTTFIYSKINQKTIPVAGYVSKADRAWIEIDLNNLEHNVNTLKQAMPENCELMAVVKADAYGHGAFEVSTYINRMGVNAFAVATIEEGIKLRQYGIEGEILILGYTNPLRAKELHKYALTQTLIDYDHAESLDKQGYRLKVHMKIDTGMHRLGFDVNDVENILKIFDSKNFRIDGIYSHLCVADSLLPEEVEFTNRQIQSFYGLLAALSEKGVKLPKIHLQSSYGFLNYPDLKCNYVRAGVSLYGVLSAPKDETKLRLDLRPVLSLKSQVILTRKIKSGDIMGYGRAFTATRDTRIAILSIGYADGIPRDLSCGIGKVLIRGNTAPIVGRVCMDQLAVDITDIPDVRVGDVATLIGEDDRDELKASEVADASNTITNELLSRMGTRLKVIMRG
ncbi:MAG: vanTG [Herbinix sp.]|jgi:serine/alanine racemase|nr:vanTG [Herbinix sp.]